MLVGLVAGLLAFAFAYVVGEPQVERAIAFENSLAATAHEAPGAELVTRGLQRTAGLATGTVAIGVAFGGLFALVFAYAYGRIGALGARATAAMLALGAYATITLVPFTKYPANPPAVGSAETVDKRTLLYFAMLAITALAFVAAARLQRQLRERLGPWNASIAAGAAFVLLIAVAQLILPAVRETPAGFPADVLYQFRVASLGTHATLWLTIGLGFGAAAQRLLVR
jgi:predicted cobalt transporter CbtA